MSRDRVLAPVPVTRMYRLRSNIGQCQRGKSSRDTPEGPRTALRCGVFSRQKSHWPADTHSFGIGPVPEGRELTSPGPLLPVSIWPAACVSSLERACGRGLNSPLQRRSVGEQWLSESPAEHSFPVM